jgi:nudix motif 8
MHCSVSQHRSSLLAATALPDSAARSFSSSPLRGLDEAFPDLKSRFLDMSFDVAPRRQHKDRKHGVVVMPHPYPKVFPLLTLKQRDHFFRRYRKKSNATEASQLASELSSSSRNLSLHEPQQHQPKAAVLVLLCTVNREPSVVLTRRSPRLSSHAGEISFPGGHNDPRHDSNLLDTALREAREELAPIDPRYLELDELSEEKGDDHVNRPRLTMLGPTTSVPSLKGIPVKPFVAAILNQNLTHPISSVFPGDRSEVDLVFAMSIRHLLTNETTHELPQNRFGMVHAPLFPTPYGSDIWGLTAFILRPLLHKLLKPVLEAGEGRVASLST